MRTLLRRGFIASLIAGAAYGLWRTWAKRRPMPGNITWESQPFPAPPRPVPNVPTGMSVDDVVSGNGAASHRHVHVPPHVDVEGGPEIEDEPELPTGVEPAVDAVDGACPASHPVKGKLASGIYHVPGGANYERTNADRCFLDAAAAEAAGLRPSKR